MTKCNGTLKEQFEGISIRINIPGSGSMMIEGDYDGVEGHCPEPGVIAESSAYHCLLRGRSYTFNSDQMTRVGNDEGGLFVGGALVCIETNRTTNIQIDTNRGIRWKSILNDLKDDGKECRHVLSVTEMERLNSRCISVGNTWTSRWNVTEFTSTLPSARDKNMPGLDLKGALMSPHP